MRHVTSLVLLITVATGVANAQLVRKGGTRSGAGAARTPDRLSPLSTAFARSGLHKPILPKESTFDTLWFLPPAGLSDPANPNLRWTVRNVTIQIDSLDYPNDESLDISIIHAGSNDTLVHGLGRSGANFIGTVFADSAAVSIADGNPPFTGEFGPARPLSQFTTLDATGSWILEIFSDATGMSGTLRDWGISLDIITSFTSVAVDPFETPVTFQLLQNYPNPFNPTTTFQFSIVDRQLTIVKVFDILGRDVATLVNEVKEPGTYTVRFDATGLSSGVYLCQMKAGNFTRTHKLLLMR